MEKNRIVKVYSNNSKKSRLKRNKNKFQRIWDVEKQTYVKVRKTKYPISTYAKKKDWREIDNSSALLRRSKTTKKQKSVPVSIVQKPETKQQVHKEPARIHGKITTTQKVKIYKISGVDYTWDNKNFKYRRAAL